MTQSSLLLLGHDTTSVNALAIFAKAHILLYRNALVLSITLATIMRYRHISNVCLMDPPQSKFQQAAKGYD